MGAARDVLLLTVSAFIVHGPSFHGSPSKQQFGVFLEECTATDDQDQAIFTLRSDDTVTFHTQGKFGVISRFESYDIWYEDCNPGLGTFVYVGDDLPSYQAGPVELLPH